MRKRFLCLSMACLLSVTALAACTGDNGGSGSSTPTPKPNQTEEDTKKPDESKPNETKPSETEEQTTPEEVKDMGGLEVIIGDWWTDPDAEPQTKLEKATKEFREKNMQKYNYKVTQKAIASWGEFNDGIIANDISTEDYKASVYVLDTGFVPAPLNNDLLYDLATLDNLDLTDEKWNQATIEFMTRGDHVYGLSIGDTEPRLGVFFNKRLLKEAGYDEDYLYDVQKDGKWNWAEYEKVCKACTRDTDGDGVMDVYATASFSADFFPAVATAAGQPFIDVDKDGHYVNNTTSAAFIEAMNWGVSMIKQFEMPQPEDSQWDWFIGAFKDGQVAMTTAEEYKVGNWADMDDDWGFVMFPYDQDHTDHCVQLVRENVLVIPSSFDKEKAENIAYVLDKYANPTPGYEDTDDWAASFYNKFRDERAVDETLGEMRKSENQKVNYMNLVQGINSGDLIFNIAGTEPAATPAEKVEELKDQWQAAIDEINAKF